MVMHMRVVEGLPGNQSGHNIFHGIFQNGQTSMRICSETCKMGGALPHFFELKPSINSINIIITPSS